MRSEQLPILLALARAGAAGRAWGEFVAAGFEASTDPSYLALRGRLLKERAASAGTDADRRNLYREAAAAYSSAAGATGGTYPLINAAALSLLSGDRSASADQAAEALKRVDANPDEPETPYWRSATRAEALLLLDHDAEARTAFAEAIALAPLAWEDHASTLRQFGLVLAEQGKDASWLDAHRPPRSLHFGGHMSFDAGVSRREHLDEKIAAVLDEEKVGFGYGALAAGADIIVAEALLERGAELHAVLPGGAEAFAAVSVDPFGSAWRERFDALLERSATVRAIRPIGTAPDRTMIALADEIAMGAAAMNARRLESRALQLLVAPGDSGEAGTEGGGPGSGTWRRRVVAAPREASATASPALPAEAHRRLAVLTVVAEASERLEALATGLPDSPPPVLGPYFTGREIVVGYGAAAEGATVALGLASKLGAAVGGHYGAARPLRDPFTGEDRLGGESAALAAAAGASAPAGSVCVTADFAAALSASQGTPIHSEMVGELDSRDGRAPVDLFALKALL
jgi:hypothetical protein